METKDKNKKGQWTVAITQLVCMVAFVVGAVLIWDGDFWDKKDYIGNIFGPLGDLIEYTFSSWTNAIVLCILAIVYTSIMTAALFKNNQKHIGGYYIFISITFGGLELLSLVFHFIIFSSCTPTKAMLYSIFTASSYVALIPFAVTQALTCMKCWYFNTKKEISKATFKEYETNYVPGGYRTVKADIKDESGTVIGSVEGKRYEEGYSYTSSSKKVVKTYQCTNCGDITKVEHTD